MKNLLAVRVAEAAAEAVHLFANDLCTDAVLPAEMSKAVGVLRLRGREFEVTVVARDLSPADPQKE